ncbi:MAG TPA: hypothetical protein DD001_23595, partial [Microcoleaceae bacterium UBA10368]|nr:hypothetical protein [Microcoleaceae cyanobacterium UBA10368]
QSQKPAPTQRSIITYHLEIKYKYQVDVNYWWGGGGFLYIVGHRYILFVNPPLPERKLYNNESTGHQITSSFFFHPSATLLK